ncbi:hypothetical protein HPB48_008232 [Haemaphysalis longicornis]|uniref:Uncharacterized protein n=1 Tax=Haemaphysalis longicornis TaxID=44386 RepID=A0A9J6GZZ0_HAELO|nr:hypothetical protein HPB48_008232 [Haemaphysalis longicornis]
MCEAEKADIAHILYECPELQPKAERQLSNQIEWETAVTSSEPETQIQAVDWALEVAMKQGPLATSRSQEEAHHYSNSMIVD